MTHTEAADHGVEVRENSKLRVIDMFAGIGGMSLGLHRTGGFETVAVAEVDSYASRVLTKRFPDVPNLGDVTKAEYPDADFICAGFPCQDISNAGSRAGITGERSGLWQEVVRAIRLVRPKFTLLENVAALLQRGMGTVLGDLAEVGHDAEWHCIPASAVGAPHGRDRAWIVTNSAGERQSRPRQLVNAINPSPNSFREANYVIDAFQRHALPYVCGRHDGVPARLAQDRLRALGNSLLPQIPELIGNAILASIRKAA